MIPGRRRRTARWCLWVTYLRDTDVLHFKCGFHIELNAQLWSFASVLLVLSLVYMFVAWQAIAWLSKHGCCPVSQTPLGQDYSSDESSHDVMSPGQANSVTPHYLQPLNAAAKHT